MSQVGAINLASVWKTRICETALKHGIVTVIKMNS